MLRSLLVFCLTAMVSHASLSERWNDIKKELEPAKIKKKIKKEIMELDIGFDVKLLDLESWAGVGLSSKYRYEVEPSYQDDYYTRIDKWRIKSNLNPGDWVDSHSLPISVGINAGVDITFVRQFKNQKKAFKALPYTPVRIPFNAKRAIEKLEPGDFVGIPAHLNLVVGANASVQEGVFEAGINTHYVLSGQFMIHIYRMKNNRVRMRLIAVRKRGTSLGGTLGADFEVFGISLVDKQIKKLLDVNLNKWSIGKEQGTLFLLDYIFDLNNEDARDAYDRILASSLKFKSLKVLNPFLSKRKLEQQIIGDLTKAELLFEEDRDKDKEDRRVDRVFKGLNDFKGRNSKFKLGMNLIRFEKNRVFTENHITHTDRYEQQRHFYYPTWSIEKKRKFLFGLFKSSQLHSVFALYLTDAQRKNHHFTDYGFYSELKDKRFYGYEAKELKKHIRRMIPQSLYDQIQWGQWEENEKRENARFNSQVLFHREAVMSLKGITENEIYAAIAKLLETLPALPEIDEDDEDNFVSRPRPWRKWPQEKKDALNMVLEKYYDDYWYSMKKMVEEMARIFTWDSEGDYENQLSALLELRKHRCFNKIGVGLLISMLPQDRLDEMIHVNLELGARKTNKVKFSFGEHGFSEFYDELKYVFSVLNNRSFDLRLHEKEEDYKEESIKGKRQVDKFGEIYDN